MNDIDGEDSRMQFRVEAFFLLFIFITKNKLTKESPANQNNKVKSEKDTVERTGKIFFSWFAIFFIFHIRFLIYFSFSEVITISDDENDYEPADVKPCIGLESLLKNPLVLKKELN